MNIQKIIKPINLCNLIEEIKKRPSLYDPRRRPNSTETRKAMWEQVGKAIFDELWDTTSEDEKECLVKEIQVKWKSLRDNYTRVLRKDKMDEAAGVPSKKKKYIYFDQLNFLEPYCTSKSPNVIFLDESQNSNDSNVVFEPEDDTLQFIHVPNNSTMQSSSTNQDEDNSKPMDKIADLLEEVVAMQRDEKHDDPMGNKKFLLSLLPFMKKLTDDVNLEVRMQLMSVLQSYTSGKKYC